MVVLGLVFWSVVLFAVAIGILAASIAGFIIIKTILKKKKISRAFYILPISGVLISLLFSIPAIWFAFCYTVSNV